VEKTYKLHFFVCRRITFSIISAKFDQLQFAKTKLENERITPAQHQELLEVQKELTEQLNLFQAENRHLSTQLAKINQQDWITTLAEKIRSEKTKLAKLENQIRNQLTSELLGANLKFFLVTNKQLVNLVMGGVKEHLYSPIQESLVESWAKLQTQISFTELRNLWQVHSQIIKMEFQHQQWMEWQNSEQELEAQIEIKPKSDY